MTVRPAHRRLDREMQTVEPGVERHGEEREYDAAFVIADGLSALAIHQNAVPAQPDAFLSGAAVHAGRRRVLEQPYPHLEVRFALFSALFDAF
jgi:ethanolamine ammonia-lyase small subunit